MMRNKKSIPPPKPNLTQRQSEAEDRRQLDQSLQRYTCQLPADLSERTRLLGLRRGKNVCPLVFEAVDKFVKENQEV